MLTFAKCYFSKSILRIKKLEIVKEKKENTIVSVVRCTFSILFIKDMFLSVNTTKNLREQKVEEEKKYRAIILGPVLL